MFEIQNLYLSYKDKIVFSDFSINIPVNKIVGILGPNGSGKTSLIECIEGLRSIDSGTIKYNGKLLTKDTKHLFSIQFQEASFFSNLKIIEIFNFIYKIHKLTIDPHKLLHEFGLLEFQNKYYGKLSGGIKQKVQVAAAFVNTSSEVIFLDEPTNGLDVFSRKKLWNNIKNRNNESKSIILTTHYIEEAEYLCDYIVIIQNGKIIFQGDTKELLHRDQNDNMFRIITSKQIDIDIFSNHRSMIKDIIQEHGTEYIYSVYFQQNNSNDFIEFLNVLHKNEHTITSINTHNRNLESAFMSALGFNITENGDITN